MQYPLLVVTEGLEDVRHETARLAFDGGALDRPKRAVFQQPVILKSGRKPG